MIGFAHPWMLIGLAAAALPVAIHFLTRPRPRSVRLPTFHLLVAAGSGRQALHRLRTFLLLALRTLLIVMAVLVFAGPVLLPAAQPETPDDAERRVVLLIDASLSMRAAEGGAGVTLFAKARALASDVLRQLPASTTAGVVYISAEPRAVLPALSRNLSALHEGLLETEQATYEQGDPGAALALADRMLGGKGEVFIFSDFQRGDWASVDLSRHAGLSLLLRPVTQRGVENVGVTALAMSPAEPIEGETIEVTATVFNATPSQRRQTVRLDLEGVTQDAAVDLAPFSSNTAVFTFALPQPTRLAGTVSIEPDNLNEDNTRYFRLRVREALQVLVLSDADRQDNRSAALFTATALSPSPYAATGLSVTRRLGAEADRNALETADAFFLVAPLRLSGETAQVIARRVADGACLVCMLDGESAPETLSTLTGAFEGAFTPPFTLLRAVHSDGEGERFARARTNAGPLKLFDGPEQGDLTDLRFRRRYVTEDTSSSASDEDIWIRYGDGSAALSLSSVGRGSVALLNLPLEPDQSNLAGHPLFPSLLHELMRALRRSAEESDNTPGKPWFIDVVEASGSAGGDEQTPYAVIAPDGQAQEVTLLSRGRSARLALGAPRLPGHYAVRRGEQVIDSGAVNPPPRETDTRPVDLTTLVRDAESGDAGGRRIAVMNDEAQLLASGQPRELWPLALLIAGCAIAGEMLLLAAWRQARPSSGGDAVERRAA